MTSEERMMGEIHDILKAVWNRDISADDGLDDIESALHSVEAEKPKPVGHFYNRPSEGRVGVEWCCDHLDDGAALYAEPVGVEAEKEPDAYMDSWEYRDFQKRGSGTVFSSPKHMGKSVPFYLRAACNQAEEEPDWIKTDHQMPGEEDEDIDATIWALNSLGGIERISSYKYWYDEKYYTHWKPTGLCRPAPPEHKPE